MSDDELAAYLEDNGYPDHIVRAGGAGLVRRWREFVSEVEQGYPYRLDDYRHDLDIRGALAVTGLDQDSEIREADERLRALLVATGQRIWESVAGAAFWDFGYPRNASGRLKRDLAAEGLFQAES